MESYKKVTWAAIAATIIVALVAGYFLFFAPKESPLPATDSIPEKSEIKEIPKTEEKTEESSFPDLSPLDLELNESDFTLRQLVKELSTHPLVAKSLISEDLIRKFVAIISNIADGDTPVFHLQDLTPAKGFQVIKRGEKYFMNSRGYTRYAPFANAFASLNTQQCINLYLRLKPSFNKANQELGDSDTTFESRFNLAIEVLLQTPQVSGMIQLEKKVISYAYKDNKLEQLNPVQKHLLRMGPENQKKIQDKLKEFKEALD